MQKVEFLPLFLCLILHSHYGKVFVQAKCPPPPPARAYLRFLSMKQLGVSRSITSSPLGEILVHCKMTPSSFLAFYPTSLIICQYPFILLGGTVRVNCFVQECNTLTQPGLIPDFSSQSPVH